jgi:hypothetical protein
MFPGLFYFMANRDSFLFPFPVFFPQDGCYGRICFFENPGSPCDLTETDPMSGRDIPLGVPVIKILEEIPAQGERLALLFREKFCKQPFHFILVINGRKNADQFIE